jgi:tRNA uridine 5-carboxymethylaminomethyl modification enzyme
LLKRPEIGYRDLETFDSLPIKNSEIREQVETLLKYEGYLGRLEDEVKRFNQMEDEKIPDGTDFRKVPNLSNEAIEKLTSTKPASMGQAMRIPGITPADVMNLSVYIRSQRRTAIERKREK